MRTLRSQTASSSKGKGKGKAEGASEDAAMGESHLSSNPPLGPATPTQDHEIARQAVTPVTLTRRSRRLNVEVASEVTLDLLCPKSEGRRKSDGKRKADEYLQEVVSRKNSSIEASTHFFQDLSLNLSIGPTCPTYHQAGIAGSGCAGKRKADESLQEVVSRKNSSIEASTHFFQDLSLNLSIGPICPTYHQAGIAGSGCAAGCGSFVNDGKAISDHFVGSSHVIESTSPNALVRKHNTEMQFEVGEVSAQLVSSPSTLANKHDMEMESEVGEVSIKLDSKSVEDGGVASMNVEEHQQQKSDIERLQRLQEEARVPSGGRRTRNRAEESRSRFLEIARNRAAHFAHFNADGDEAPAGAPPPRAGRRRGRQPRQVDEHNPQPQPQPQEVDWPGPFSTARQLVNNRARAAAARQNADVPGSKVSVVDWKPTRVPGNTTFSKRKCPSLQDLCLSVLADNAENVVSLEGVPDLVRLRINAAFCERRKMSSKTLALFFEGEPSEVHSLDCTQVCEDDLVEMMKQLCPGRLEKLHLGYCGRALSERCLSTTIASPAASTPLKSISLKGAYRLSDQGLEALLRASPQLVHLDLSNCSFLTNASVEAVAQCVGQTLESLVLDGCPNLNATVMVHDIVRLSKLQKLSLAEVAGVTDEVVSEICVQLGLNLRELVLTRCISLTNAAVAAIGACCSSLQRLNLAHLPMLTDVAIAHITDSLSKIQDLNLQRCKFSDEAIATFVTASGASLVYLSLNSVQQVADQTMVALARHSHVYLECLDLSFCRLVDDECLGLLADSCLQLRELRLFGCTQVTQKFLNGHSNDNLTIVGLA